MQSKRFILLVVISMVFVTLTKAQHKRYSIKNGIGVYGGITQFDILTDNFSIKKQQGWIGGLSATVDLPHKWYTVSYNVQLSENNFAIEGRTSNVTPVNKDIEYKLFTAQVAFLFHAKILDDYLTVDVGPMLQYNGDLQLKNDAQEEYYISNFDNLQADEITGISKFNVNGAVGLSAGFSHFKIRGQYIYGFTNMLNKLNKQDLDTSGYNAKFKGNQSMFAITAMITF